MSKQNTTTFESLGVHRQLCAALADRGIVHPRDIQRRTLQHTVHDYADIIAEAAPHSGRNTLLAVFSAHCALCSSESDAKSSVLILADDRASCLKVFHVLNGLAKIARVTATICLDDNPPSTLLTAKASVVLTTFEAIVQWRPEKFAHVVTLAVEDCSRHDKRALQDVIERMIQVSPSANVFMLSTVPPSEVDVAIRYLLRRKNRRYYFKENAPPKFSYLLSTDAKDREALKDKLMELPGLRTVLLLTHNREVRDLKASLPTWNGKSFGIQRNTTAQEHDRTLSDFLRSPFAALVAMDAYTGVDLMDLDAVIQFYPPQKSMPESEWSEFMAYLHSTNNPENPTQVITLVGTDDFALVSYFMKRVGMDGPVINISPTHPQFVEAVRCPDAIVREKLKLHEGSNQKNSSIATAGARAAREAPPKVSPTQPAEERGAIPIPRSQRLDEGHRTPPVDTTARHEDPTRDRTARLADTDPAVRTRDREPLPQRADSGRSRDGREGGKDGSDGDGRRRRRR